MPRFKFLKPLWSRSHILASSVFLARSVKYLQHSTSVFFWSFWNCTSKSSYLACILSFSLRAVLSRLSLRERIFKQRLCESDSSSYLHGRYAEYTSLHVTRIQREKLHSSKTGIVASTDFYLLLSTILIESFSVLAELV